MRRTTLTVLLTLMGLASGLACARQQPMADGKPLSHWVREARHASMLPFGGSGRDERRLRAHLRLREIGEPAVPALLDLLKSSNRGVSHDAYTTLCTLGERARAAVPRATEMLVSKHADDRIRGATLLSRIGAAAVAALPELEAALADPDERVRHEAAAALAAAGEPGRLVLARANVTVATLQTASVQGEPAKEPMSPQARRVDEALRAESADVRAQAFLGVAPLSQEEAEDYTEPLIRGMHDESPLVRDAARRAYGRLRQSQRLSNAMLVDVLRRGDADSQADAAWQLGMPRVPREYTKAEIAALTGALAASESRLRIYAARALLESGSGVDFVTPTRDALETATDIQVKVTAARVLWSTTRSAEGLVEIVEEGLSAQDRVVKRDAIELAGEMGPKAPALRPTLERLIHDPDVDIAELARRALGN